MNKSELVRRLKALGACLNSSGGVSKDSLNRIVKRYSFAALEKMNPDFKENFKSHLIKKGWKIDNITKGKDRDYTPIHVTGKSDNREQDLKDYVSALKKAEAGYLAECLRRNLNHRELFKDQKFGMLHLGVSAPGHAESTRRIWVANDDDSLKVTLGAFYFTPEQGLKTGGTITLSIFNVGEFNFKYDDFGSIATEYSVPDSMYAKLIAPIRKGLRNVLIKKNPEFKEKELD